MVMSQKSKKFPLSDNGFSAIRGRTLKDSADETQSEVEKDGRSYKGVEA
jgi:hypothetical protein